MLSSSACVTRCESSYWGSRLLLHTVFCASPARAPAVEAQPVERRRRAARSGQPPRRPDALPLRLRDRRRPRDAAQRRYRRRHCRAHAAVGERPHWSTTLVSLAAAEEDRVAVYGTRGGLVFDRYRSTRLIFVPRGSGQGVGASRGCRPGARRSPQSPGRVRDAVRPPRETSFEAALAAFAVAVRGGRLDRRRLRRRDAQLSRWSPPPSARRRHHATSRSRSWLRRDDRSLRSSFRCGTRPRLLERCLDAILRQDAAPGELRGDRRRQQLDRRVREPRARRVPTRRGRCPSRGRAPTRRATAASPRLRPAARLHRPRLRAAAGLASATDRSHRRPRTMVVTGRDRPAGASRSMRLLGEYDHVKEVVVMESADPSIYYAHTNNLITRREVFDRVGLFDERARGGDVIFVQRVLALYGTGAVRYEPRAHVEHLEISTARGCTSARRFSIGQSARRYSSASCARGRCATRSAFASSGRPCDARAFPLPRPCLLFLLLAVGVGYYQLGWLRGGAPPAAPETGRPRASCRYDSGTPPQPDARACSRARHAAQRQRFCAARSGICAQQTVRDRIEIILVGPDARAFDDLDPATMDVFAGWSTLARGPDPSKPSARSDGRRRGARRRWWRCSRTTSIRIPTGPPRCSPRTAGRGRQSAASSTTPTRAPATSWVEHLLSYGFHDSSMPGARCARVSRNNVVFKRSVLSAFGARLPDALARDGGLLGGSAAATAVASTASRGARSPHLNVSRLLPMLTLRVFSARASAATRARVERWARRRNVALRARKPRLSAAPASAGARGRACARDAGTQVPVRRSCRCSDSPCSSTRFGQAIGFAAGAGESGRARRTIRPRSPSLPVERRSRAFLRIAPVVAVRVLLVHDFGTLNGGAEIMIWQLREALRARGHQTLLFTSTARPLPLPIVSDATCFGTVSPARRVAQAINPHAAWRLRACCATSGPTSCT